MAWLLLIVPIAMVVTLKLRGRPWHRNKYSQRWIDGWTVTHLAWGSVFYGTTRAITFNSPWLNVFAIAVVLGAIWESVENRNWMIRLFRSGGDTNYWGDSIANSCGDLAACAAGAVLTMLCVG